MERMMGGPGADCGACARANTVAKSAQREAIQIATGGERIHPQKRCICQKRSPTQKGPAQDRRLYRKEDGNRQDEIFFLGEAASG